MYVVPRDEVLSKLAAMQAADALGRQFAQDQAVEKLAKMAGVFLAQTQNKMSLEKLAQAMVFAGELSAEEYEMLKEAGWAGKMLKRFGRGVSAKATGAASTVGEGLSGVKSRVGRIFKKPPKPEWVPNPARPKMSPNAAYNARRGTPGAAPTPQAAAQAPSAATKAPAAAPGNVKPAPQSTSAPSAPAPSTTSQSAPAPSTKAPAKGRGWGSALPWMAAGGLGYGLYKGVPWAARQLEATSTTPMAYNAGWSPVGYGYTQSPYGTGVPTMGPGV
jgi:hypothetical protein